jgi:hypothetical protein
MRYCRLVQPPSRIGGFPWTTEHRPQLPKDVIGYSATLLYSEAITQLAVERTHLLVAAGKGMKIAGRAASGGEGTSGGAVLTEPLETCGL